MYSVGRGAHRRTVNIWPGFVDGLAHNRFVNDLEEWLSGITRLGGAGPVGDGFER